MHSFSRCSLLICTIIIIIHHSQCFEPGFMDSLPFRTTSPSPSGTTHYAITECALLKTAADYLKKVHEAIGLESVGSSTGICARVEQDREVIAAETTRLRISNNLRSAIYQISERNVVVDLREPFNPNAHFDDESFTNGSKLVKLRIDNAVDKLKRGDVDDARDDFGAALHTIQDFYSHSNWIELGNTEPNPFIGSGTLLGRYAPKNMPTCRNCTDRSCAESNILPEITANGFLTSGYFSACLWVPFSLCSSAKKPRGKCSHGGSSDKTTTLEATGFGINKDSAESDHGTYHHFEAARVAYEATRQHLIHFWEEVGDESFGRFLGFATRTLAFAIDTTGSMSPYIELVKQVAIRITESTTDASSFIRPHQYVLSPFNDPNFGPLTVTKDPQELIDAISALTATGGGDLPELYYHGVDAALKVSERDSFIFTFTDAPAKDRYLRGQVLSRAIKLNSRIHSFYAGVIGFPGRRKRQTLTETYDIDNLDGSDGHDVATLTGGFTIGIQSTDANATADYVIRRLERSQTILTINVLGPTNMTFEVDSTMTVLNIDISSSFNLTNFVEVTDPTGRHFQPSLISATNFFQLYSIEHPINGTWTVHSSQRTAHSIELSGISSTSCIITLCERDKRESSEGCIPLSTEPIVNQTGLFLFAVCDNLPTAIRNGTILLVNSNGTSISRLMATVRGNRSFITPIEVPNNDFRMVTIVDLVNGTRIQRQATQFTSSTFISIEILDQPYMMINNGSVNVTFTIYNQATMTLDIKLCVTDTLQLLNASVLCMPTYNISSFGNITDQLTVFDSSNENRTNATSSTITFTITAAIESGLTSKNVSNYNTMTLYFDDGTFKEESFTSTSPTTFPSTSTIGHSDQIVFKPLCGY